jgi:ubiquinone/menaquinone biosynthesis C-methylase UbiE
MTKTNLWKKINSFSGNHSSPLNSFYRTCPICGSDDYRKVFEHNDFQFFTDSVTIPKRIDIIENICNNCYALFLNPCYSTYGFSSLFSEAGRSYGQTESRPLEQIKWMNDRELLKSGGYLFDAGCYMGDFLAQFPMDIHKVGLDIDAPAIAIGKQKHKAHNIKFVLGDFETFQYQGENPDVITMFHVLEHLPRPVEALKKLRSVSHDKTYLIIEVPIIENGLTNDINGFFSIQHMTHFSRTSLSNCINKAGWEILEIFEQTDYNGCRVLAQPAKEEIAYLVNEDSGDFAKMQTYLSNWYRSALAVEYRIGDIINLDKLYIWGGGAHTEFLYKATSLFLRNRNAEYIIIDSDPLKQGKTWRGINIVPSSQIEFSKIGNSKVLISSYGSQPEILRILLEKGVPREQIITLYETIQTY